MSGRPRTKRARELGVQPGQVPAEEVRPRLRVTRAARRRAQFQEEYGKAKTALDRLTCAYDYFRGAASRRCPDAARVEALIQAFTDGLIAAGDELLEAQSKERRNP